MMEEERNPILGYEGTYDMTPSGRIYSIQRKLTVIVKVMNTVLSWFTCIRTVNERNV